MKFTVAQSKSKTIAQGDSRQIEVVFDQTNYVVFIEVVQIYPMTFYRLKILPFIS